MQNPFIIGEKIYLEPIEMPDTDAFVSWLNDGEVRQFLLRSFPIYDPDDRLDENHWTGSSRITYQFTKDLFWRNFLRFRRHWDSKTDRRDETWLVDAFLGYTFQPGSIFYLVYNQSWDNSGGKLRTKDRAVIAKGSYWRGL